MMPVLLVNMECKGIEVEELFSQLSGYVEPKFKIWLYKKKVYSVFRISSFSILKELVRRLDQINHFKYTIFRIEEVS